ncbi:unnamed protein product [Pedinophyceae sp. YPF-701]|nr:unnamed protein product [Pedinophyceae sp. YPF-701]
MPHCRPMSTGGAEGHAARPRTNAADPAGRDELHIAADADDLTVFAIDGGAAMRAPLPDYAEWSSVEVMLAHVTEFMKREAIACPRNRHAVCLYGVQTPPTDTGHQGVWVAQSPARPSVDGIRRLDPQYPDIQDALEGHQPAEQDTPRAFLSAVKSALSLIQTRTARTTSAHVHFLTRNVDLAGMGPALAQDVRNFLGLLIAASQVCSVTVLCDAGVDAQDAAERTWSGLLPSDGDLGQRARLRAVPVSSVVSALGLQHRSVTVRKKLRTSGKFEIVLGTSVRVPVNAYSLFTKCKVKGVLASAGAGGSDGASEASSEGGESMDDAQDGDDVESEGAQQLQPPVSEGKEGAHRKLRYIDYGGATLVVPEADLYETMRPPRRKVGAIHILAFEASPSCGFERHIGTSTFLSPTDRGNEVFAALHAEMTETEQAAVCTVWTRHGVKLARLVAVEQRHDQSGAVVVPCGMMLTYLPFTTGDKPVERLAVHAGALIDEGKPTEQQVEAARSLVDAMQLTDMPALLPTTRIPNPHNAARMAGLRRIAFDDDRPFKDETDGLLDSDARGRGVALLGELLHACAQGASAFVPAGAVEERSAGTKRKRVEETEAQCVAAVERKWAAGSLMQCTVHQLKGFLTSKGQVPAGKKVELVEQAKRVFAEHA